MLRKRGRKMSQAELGEAAGVSDAMIGFYESETNEPS
jgi:transcriptional regulator with XRE-family HTH domain